MNCNHITIIYFLSKSLFDSFCSGCGWNIGSSYHWVIAIVYILLQCICSALLVMANGQEFITTLNPYFDCYGKDWYYSCTTSNGSPHWIVNNDFNFTSENTAQNPIYTELLFWQQICAVCFNLCIQSKWSLHCSRTGSKSKHKAKCFLQWRCHQYSRHTEYP